MRMKVIWTVFLSISVVGGSDTCYLEGFSQPSYNLINSTMTSPELCQAFCQRTPDCAAFTWTRGTQRCNLKTSWYGRKNERAGKVSGPAFCLKSACFKVDRAVVGSNLNYWWIKHNSNTPEECQAICQKTVGCGGFTWVESTKLCRLKKSFPEETSLAPREGRVSGPAYCTTKVGGTCPPPSCVANWSYNGQRQVKITTSMLI